MAVIEAENITYRYPNSSPPVLQGFSAHFERGEITAVSGRNGCGKTTFSKLLVGILQPTEGIVAIDGCNTANMDLFEIGQLVGYVFQNPARQLFCDSSLNEVAFGLRNLKLDEKQAAQKASYYLELFDLARYAETYPGKLSIGEKQRLALAAVLALGTNYIVLDEPTTGLDMRHLQELGDILVRLSREKNCGIIVVSHSANFIARYADRELVMP